MLQMLRTINARMIYSFQRFIQKHRLIHKQHVHLLKHSYMY